MRATFFGPAASTRWSWQRLQRDVPFYSHVEADIRDADAIEEVFARYGANISVVIHTAAQPSHDWAAREPMTDFTVNANGTLILLEAVRKHCPDAVFIFCSTNKVYGDTPNRLPLVERETRWEPDASHPFAAHGIDEIDEHRRLQAQPVRRLEMRGRSDGAGIRPLFRHEDRLLPRRLPDRARPFRRRSCTAFSPTS